MIDKKNRNRFYLAATIVLFILYVIILFYKLATVPTLFVDEANYANEVISFTHFGTDIHGFHHPLYFSSVWGQGQSILYSLIVRPVIKVFGFSFLSFRFPMAFLSLLLIGLLCGYIFYVSRSYLATFLMMLAFVTSPGWYVMSRWVLDANIAPLFVSFSVIALLFFFLRKKSSSKFIWFIISAILISFSAYGYVATWLYLPIFLTILFGYLYREGLLPFKPIILYVSVVTVLVLPLIYFAYNIFVKHISQPTKFLWFNISPLPRSRTSSLIDFSGNVANTMFHNIVTGFSMYITGSDGLSRNTIPPFGMIFPWVLIFFAIVGILYGKQILPEKLNLLKRICIIALISFLPMTFIVIPNYTHWNLIHVPLIILCGFGMYIVIKKSKKCFGTLLIILLTILPMIFFIFQYFQVTSPYRTGNIRQFSMKNTKAINQFMERKRKSYLFTRPVSRNFVYFRTFQKPIDHGQYLKLQETKPEFENRMGPIRKYGYLRDMSEFKTEYRGHHDYILAISKVNAKNIETHDHIRLRTVKKFKDGKLIYTLNKAIQK